MEQERRQGENNDNFEIRRLRLEDYEEYCVLRAEGLLDSPMAFTTSYADFVARTDENKKEIYLSSIGEKSENFTLAVFVPIEDETTITPPKKRMVGLTGFGRETREKTRHKGTLVSVYVTPKYRGKGLSRKMLQQALALVRTMEGAFLLLFLFFFSVVFALYPSY
jgi:GNAT superfamily N-acetyltransferase